MIIKVKGELLEFNKYFIVNQSYPLSISYKNNEYKAMTILEIMKDILKKLHTVSVEDWLCERVKEAMEHDKITRIK